MDYAISTPLARFRNILGISVWSFAAQWIFFVIPALYLATNWYFLRGLHGHGIAPIMALLFDLLSFSLPVGIIGVLIVRLVQYIFIEKPEHPALVLLSEIKELFTKPARIINAMPVFLAMIFFNKAMVELKPAIPAINPFSWDTTFAQLDRTLHFGVDPWVLLQPLMGYDSVTFAVNIAYDFWFVALFGTWLWFGFRKDANELRTRFFLAYMLSWWVGGGILALVFSSAGPVYYSAIGLTPDPFAAHMAYLNGVNSRVPIWAMDAQKLLWDGYIGKAVAIGISAFPSMHNASAMLFALALSKCSRGLGYVFFAYVVVIFLGSVHLGWHYAIDGYAGIIIGYLGWVAAGPIARWFTQLETTRRFNASLASL